MFQWQIRGRVLSIATRPLVMGIVNVTPDSFSDGGHYASPERAIAHGLELERQGADILDVGGESTRPGAEPVALAEEMGRVLPVVQALAGQVKTPISVDTSKSAVARACLEAGAHIINDVTGLGDPDMVAVARESGAGVILMHMQGTPATMQLEPRYDDVVNDIRRFLEQRIAEVTGQGVDRSCLAIDPGLGFGKRFKHNLEILARLGEFRSLGVPLCLGASRKGFIGKIIGRPVEQVLSGSLAVVSFALAQQAVQIVRVHDVAATRDTVLMWEALRGV